MADREMLREAMNGRIFFLGTGTSQGVPMAGCGCRTCTSTDPRDKRLRTSALVEYRGHFYQIDAGPDFRQQMLNAQSVLGHSFFPDAVLMTHNHKDHTGGLDDIRSYNYFTGRPCPLYAENAVIDSLRKEYYYVFDANEYKWGPKFDIHLIEADRPFAIFDDEIIPFRVHHGSKPIVGYRFGPLGYITDGKTVPDSTFELLRGIDTLVINTVYRAPHFSHFSLDEALTVWKRTGASRVFLTHLSHRYEPHAELAASLPEGAAPAYDGLITEF